MASRHPDQQDALPLHVADKPDAASSVPLLCSNNCGFFGSPTTNNLCSLCYKKSLRSEAPDTLRPKILQRSSRFKNPAIAVDIPAELQFSPSSPQPDASSPLPSVRPTDELSGSSEFQQRSVVTVEGPSFLRLLRNCNSESEVSELIASFPPETSGSYSRLPDSPTRETVCEPVPDTPWEWEEPILEPFPDTPWEWEEPILEPFPDTPWEWEEPILEPFPAAPWEREEPILEPLPAAPRETVPDTLPVVPSAAPSASGTDSKRSNRCKSCRKRLCLGATFKCRCGDVFCSSHRFPDQHACSFDVKAVDRQIIAKANPVIKADKLKNRI